MRQNIRAAAAVKTVRRQVANYAKYYNNSSSSSGRRTATAAAAATTAIRNLHHATPALKTSNSNQNCRSSNELGQQQQQDDCGQLTPNDARIVIIGAGLAGLSAANHLIKNGFYRTLVLEATERYGGRINSKRFGDAYCELGAKWVNIDARRDSMYELLRKANGLKKQIKTPTATAAYVQGKGYAVDAAMTERIDALFRQLCRGLRLTEKLKSGADLQPLDNVMTYFRAESDKLIRSIFNAREQPLASEVFDTLFREFGSVLGCCLEYVNIEHLSKLPAQLQSEPLPIYVPTGLDNILQSIANNIGTEQLQTGKPVGKIQWQTSSYYGRHTLLGAAPGSLIIEPQCVGCLDGSVYIADHIICTLPLGVLKTFANIMFKPALPAEKLKAINNLGYGNPLKIFLEYKNAIDDWFGFDVGLRPLRSVLPQTQEERGGWTQQLVEIARVPSSSRVLEIQVGGGYYDDIEKLSDTQLLEEITAVLKQCLANDAVPYPSALLRSNWSSSACYLGGRPYYTTNSSERDVQRLAYPLSNHMAANRCDLVPTLLFAGDATIVQGFGSVDGARASGIREAQRIIEYYKRKTLE